MGELNTWHAITDSLGLCPGLQYGGKVTGDCQRDCFRVCKYRV